MENTKIVTFFSQLFRSKKTNKRRQGRNAEISYKRQRISPQDYTTRQLIHQSIKSYDYFRMDEFIEDRDNREILLINKRNALGKTMIFEYIEVAGQNIAPEVVRRIVRTEGFDVTQKDLSGRCCFYVCLMKNVDLEIYKILIEDGKLNISQSFCTECKCNDCGSCNIVGMWFVFARQQQGFLTLLWEHNFDITAITATQLKVVVDDFKRFISKDKILLMKLHANRKTIKRPIAKLPLGALIEIAKYQDYSTTALD